MTIYDNLSDSAPERVKTAPFPAGSGAEDQLAMALPV